MRIRPAVVALSALLLPLAAMSADAIRAGKWQYTSTLQMDGMPAMPAMPEGMQLPPGMTMPKVSPSGISSRFESCITENDPVPHNRERERNCKMSQLQRNGNHFSWVATCELPDGGSAESVGEGSYSGDSSQVTVRTKMMHDGHEMNSTMNIQGHYLGPCQ